MKRIQSVEEVNQADAKVKAAALAMIETPMDLIKTVLLKHEEAVIEVMRELHQQQKADEALLRIALTYLEYASQQLPMIHASIVDPVIDELKERLK